MITIFMRKLQNIDVMKATIESNQNKGVHGREDNISYFLLTLFYIYELLVFGCMRYLDSIWICGTMLSLALCSLDVDQDFWFQT